MCISFLLFWSTISSAEDEKDITEECCIFLGEPGLVGPGGISFETKGDVMFSFGVTTRIIPTYERNWDFGINDVDGLNLVGGTANNLLVSHFTESGVNAGEYIRGQANFYINALPQDRSWSFFTLLQADSTLDVTNVDANAGAGNQQSDFGIERLHGSARLGDSNWRVHAGWDLWETDMGAGAGLVLLEDQPGIWLTGANNDRSFDWNVGWFKFNENNTLPDASSFAVADGDNPGHDRNVFAGYLNQKVPTGRIRYFYTYDDINDVPVGSISRNIAGQTTSTIASTSSNGSDAQVHHLGAYYAGKVNTVDLMFEGVYEFGSVDNAGLTGVIDGGRDSYDVSGYAFAGRVALNTGNVRPNIGFVYSSGDSDPSDGDLEGYTSNAAGTRFTAFGGENTILNDTNLVLGTAIFGFLPDGLGNGTPVFTGGIDNFAGFGMGRGDNPGLWMIQAGFEMGPFSNGATFTSNARAFGWNEDFMIESLATGSTSRTEINSGYAGTEWANELIFPLNKAAAIKFQATALFPGEGIEDITEAYGAGGGVDTKSDDTAWRAAAEFVWNF
tara:strand:- start:50205 stop:51878 length:1674 start_codon:yes stop_codon:yes gene_type:complete